MKLLWIAVPLGLIVFAVAARALPSLPEDVSIGDPPRKLGRVNSIDIYFHLGDIAIPNRLAISESDPSLLEIDQRIRYWDSYIVTSPVPREVALEDHSTLIIPWTILPRSVIETVEQLDSSFASRLEAWLGLKSSPADWKFDRVSRLDVPTSNAYHQTTGIRTIHAVNLFEFVEEFGSEYEANLESAISSASKEVVEQSGQAGDQKMAFPALAGADHVIEKNLVVPYRVSFEAIIDGIGRARGDTPSQIFLVVWQSLLGTPEMESAMAGLEMAALKRIPEWNNRLILVASGLVSVGFIVGLLVGYFSITQLDRPKLVVLIVTIIGIFPVAFGYWYLERLMKVLPLTEQPEIEIGVLSVLAFIAASLLYKNQIVRFKRE